ncbi:hypothetical protein DSM3645_07915 [Blastopirellula marina DSM 3645]|uniref:Uncharacterized protein n=1 Tax=Blastopirellula marina DSM 3645 TaxID=314230 RepID=A3ZXZ1_9BACT|nr:hypothetical protein DSM3645_07915 [Blastopirellula marina DSM 3645]
MRAAIKYDSWRRDHHLGPFILDGSRRAILLFLLRDSVIAEKFRENRNKFQPNCQPSRIGAPVANSVRPQEVTVFLKSLVAVPLTRG